MFSRKGFAFAVLFVYLFLIVAQVPISRAQQTDPLAAMSPEEIMILNNINAERVNDNLAPLSPNAMLYEAARRHVQDLASRPTRYMGDTMRGRDGSTAQDWLRQIGYPAYADGYVVGLIAFVSPYQPPADIVNFWLNDPNLEREQNRILESSFREIGVAYTYNQVNGFHYYVILFAAQPNVLPIIITSSETPGIILQSTSANQVLLWIHNENSHPQGDGYSIGSVRDIRVSNDPTFSDVLDNPNEGWEPYVNQRLWNVPPGIGEKTVYVQMRDAVRNEITSFASINYTGDLPQWSAEAEVTAIPTEQDLEAIIIATQTQAAAQTLAALVPTLTQQTIAAALTQTSAAASTTFPGRLSISVTPPSPTPPPSPMQVPSPTLPFIPTPTPTNPRPEVAQGEPRAEIRLIWNDRIFVLINTSDTPVDVSNVSFEGANGGGFGAQDWLANSDAPLYLNSLQPGSCLVAYSALETTPPPVPSSVRCSRVSARIALQPNDVIWEMRNGSFTAYPTGTDPVPCALTSRTACEIRVPFGR